MKKLIFILSLSLIITTVESCRVPGRYISKTERRMAGNSRKVVKVKESKKVRVAKSKQEKNQRKIHSGKATKASRKRTYDIQTDDVKSRMKMNDARIAQREKLKAKRSKEENKKAARKYR